MAITTMQKVIKVLKVVRIVCELVLISIILFALLCASYCLVLLTFTSSRVSWLLPNLPDLLKEDYWHLGTCLGLIFYIFTVCSYFGFCLMGLVVLSELKTSNYVYYKLTGKSLHNTIFSSSEKTYEVRCTCTCKCKNCKH